MYKDARGIIVGNCDTFLFLGGKGKSTIKELSELLGKETIDMYNASVTKGTLESHGQNFEKLGRELLAQDEIAVMDGGKCILQLRGVRPFFSEKYDIEQHSNYKYLSDANPKNAFDIEKYMSTKLKVNDSEVFDVFEVNVKEPDTQPA